jgi:hypothetical protein
MTAAKSKPATDPFVADVEPEQPVAPDPWADLRDHTMDGTDAVQYYDVPDPILRLVKSAVTTPQFVVTDGRPPEWIKAFTQHVRNSKAAAGVSRVRIVDAVNDGRRGLKITVSEDTAADE